MSPVFANGNSPPTAPVVDVTPNTPFTSDNLVCSITTPSTDLDGDNVTYSYAWSKNDLIQPDLTTDTVDSFNTSKEEVWKCVVTPNDGTIDGPAAEDQVTIGNSPPSIDSVIISPDPAYTSTNLTAIPLGWSDPDGDDEGYHWEWLKWQINHWKNIPGTNLMAAPTVTQSRELSPYRTVHPRPRLLISLRTLPPAVTTWYVPSPPQVLILMETT